MKSLRHKCQLIRLALPWLALLLAGAAPAASRQRRSATSAPAGLAGGARRLGAAGFRLGCGIEALAWSGDARKVAAAGRYANALKRGAVAVWRTADGQVIGKTQLKSTELLGLVTGELAFLPDGRRLVLSVGGQLGLWDTQKDRVYDFAAEDRHDRYLALSEDGNTLAGSARWYEGEKGIALWDVATRRKVRSFGSGEVVRFLGRPPRVASVSRGGDKAQTLLQTWDPSSATLAAARLRHWRSRRTGVCSFPGIGMGAASCGRSEPPGIPTPLAGSRTERATGEASMCTRPTIRTQVANITLYI